MVDFTKMTKAQVRKVAEERFKRLVGNGGFTDSYKSMYKQYVKGYIDCWYDFREQIENNKENE